MLSASQDVHVVATTVNGTGSALAVAIPLARSRRACLSIAVPQISSELGPIGASSDETEFITNRYRNLVHDLGGEARITIYPCRSFADILSQIPPDATVVIGGPLEMSLATCDQFAAQFGPTAARVVFVPSVF